MAVPNYAICPISHFAFRHPYVGPDGHVYEGKCLQRALKIKPISPLTMKPMSWKRCVPCHFAKKALQDLWEKHPELIDERYPLEWEEVVAGKFDEYDKFSVKDHTYAEWQQLIQTNPHLIKKMKIQDYNESTQDGLPFCWCLFTYGTLELVRWFLTETSYLPPDPIVVLVDPSALICKLTTTSHLIPLIGHRNVELVQLALNKNVKQLDGHSLCYLLNFFGSHEVMQLLHPYLDYLRCLDWNQRVNRFPDLFAGILNSVKDVYLLEFFDLIMRFPRKVYYGSLLFKQMSPTRSLGRIVSHFLRSEETLPHNTNPLYSIQLPQFSDGEVRAEWDIMVVKTGLQKKLLDAGWITLPTP